MKRGLLIGGGAVIVAIVAAVIVLGSSIDSLVEAAVEEYGSEITGAKVALAEAEISPTSGEGALRGLTVGNPPGFQTDRAFRLGEIKVAIDIGTLTEDTIVIRELSILAPEITYELGENGSNFDALQRNVDSYMKARGGGGDSGAATRPGGDADEGGKKLIIERLVVRNAKARVSAGVLAGKTMDVDLPTIEMTDVGKDKGGAKPGEVVDMVIAKVEGSLGGVLGTLDPAQLLDKMGVGEIGKKLLEGGGEGAKVLQDGGEGAKKLIEDGAKELGGGLNKLFGK